jgi:hypothetical protein
MDYTSDVSSFLRDLSPAKLNFYSLAFCYMVPLGAKLMLVFINRILEFFFQKEYFIFFQKLIIPDTKK